MKMGCFALAGEPFPPIVKRVSADAKAIIARGPAASWGCVQAARPNPTKATPVHKLITDKPIELKCRRLTYT